MWGAICPIYNILVFRYTICTKMIKTSSFIWIDHFSRSFSRHFNCVFFSLTSKKKLDYIILIQHYTWSLKPCHPKTFDIFFNGVPNYYSVSVKWSSIYFSICLAPNFMRRVSKGLLRKACSMYNINLVGKACNMYVCYETTLGTTLLENIVIKTERNKVSYNYLGSPTHAFLCFV